MKTLRNILFLTFILLISSNCIYAFNNPISFDIEYDRALPSNPSSNEIHIALEDVTEIDESQDHTIYYIDYTNNEASLMVYAYFLENVDASIVSVYTVANDKIAIRIDKVINPPITIDGVILFVVKDDIIKPVDNTPFATSSIDDVKKENNPVKEDTPLEEPTKLYPNPANQTLNLPQDNTIKNIYFVNLLSNETTFKRVNQNTLVNVQDLNEGIYLVKIENEGGQLQWVEQKLVIKH